MANDESDAARSEGEGGSVLAIFSTFLWLGLTSFGGPVAHLGYFRRAFVERRRWLNEGAFGELVGLCQFLPGPASSQVGFALGLMRGGALGGVAAWLGFTLPSALLMCLAAQFTSSLSGSTGAAALHGLRLVAVPIVAQAVISMRRTLAPDARRLTIATLAAVLVALLPLAWAQVAVIAFGALLGLLVCPAGSPLIAGNRDIGADAKWSIACLILFVILLLSALALEFAQDRSLVAMAATIYRAGALVFGGGHVVLPLLRASMVPRWIDAQRFLAGYGAAQAMPGPLFTFATYLGASAAGPAGAVVATIAIMAPGMLLVAGTLPFKRHLRSRASVRSALAGVNAAVIGILFGALCTVVVPNAILTPADAAIALVGLILIVCGLPALPLVALTVLATILGPDAWAQ